MGQFWTWSQWADSIKSCFEKCFWIPNDTQDPEISYNHGAYKDSFGSSAKFTDNQLRPNFLVTMTVLMCIYMHKFSFYSLLQLIPSQRGNIKQAPSLFTPERAWDALQIVKAQLVGPLGIKTLGPNDWAYRGYYDNSNESTDFSLAKGFNYHQGPEWLWLTGYYLRALLYFGRHLARINPKSYGHLANEVLADCQAHLARLDDHLYSSPWRSLPELTNFNGSVRIPFNKNSF
ncbi:unnamed protein product [Protopolystoma xenopodis]|uniref:Glycogen debranching enzyme C-terminal domain-containing protein n=1 Tax=Protopolystoma xenopodis TaxID=117903 RepID=A0A448WCG3_9PLAT|nr:unnamed protein product [Protopolystoma xenopodis]